MAGWCHDDFSEVKSSESADDIVTSIESRDHDVGLGLEAIPAEATCTRNMVWIQFGVATRTQEDRGE